MSFNEHLSGAYRTSISPSRPSKHTGESISYESCSTCGLVAQVLLRRTPAGFGSWSVSRVDPLTEMTRRINQIKLDAENTSRSESLRRTFRAPNGRCTCDPAHDALVMGDPKFANERTQRDNDLNRPDEAPAGWHPDPHRRAQYRLWNGRVWTELVSNNGIESIDFPGKKPLQRTEPRTSSAAPTTGKTKRSPRTGRSDLTGQLRELNDLYAAGVLTSEQFEAAKNKLLGLD